MSVDTLQPRRRRGASNSTEARVGSKIRYTRRLRGLTLKEVADAAECSESLLSKIENGRADPSLKMLQRLTTALGLTIGQLFAQEDNADNVVMHAANRVAFETGQQGDNGTRVEPLSPHSTGSMLECHLHHIAPGDGSGGELKHEGEEFGYILEGELEIIVDGKRHVASAGDSFSFRSDRPHSYRNLSKGTTQVLWINTPPTF
jgi:transcriptional regulator with XRE-family HTH domain